MEAAARRRLGGGHLIGPAIIAATGDSHARYGPLEFGQGGKHAEDRLTARKCSVDAGTVPGQHL